MAFSNDKIGPTMSSSFTGVIINPAAAGGRALKSIPLVTRSLREWSIPYQVAITTAPHDAWRMALEFAEAGTERIIAVGGDGTFNEVVNGLQESGRSVPLGLVPQGTGSDFPRTVGISTDTKTALFQACFGETRAIDLGHARLDSGVSRYFLNVAGLGFDSTVAERAARTKLPGSKTSYLSALAVSLARYSNIEVKITSPGQVVSTRAVFVTVANAKFFGGGLMIAPMADISDGMLDLAIIGNLGLGELIRQIPNVYRGKHTSHPQFTHFPIETARIEPASPALVQVDGEILGLAPVDFSVAAGAQLLTA